MDNKRTNEEVAPTGLWFQRQPTQPRPVITLGTRPVSFVLPTNFIRHNTPSLNFTFYRTGIFMGSFPFLSLKHNLCLWWNYVQKYNGKLLLVVIPSLWKIAAVDLPCCYKPGKQESEVRVWNSCGNMESSTPRVRGDLGFLIILVIQ